MTGYNGEERRDNSWHLDKRLNVGHLLTTLTLAGGMIVWAMNIETRIATQAQQINSISIQLNKQEERNTRSIDRLLVVVDKINDKLDRIIEAR